MAGSLNSVQLIGNLGKDPEARSMSNGNKVCNFSVACSETWKDKSGERQEKTEWVPVVVWGPLAEVAEKYLRKGSKVYLKGKFTTRKWVDQSGADRYSTEVVLQGFGAEMILLDGKPSGGREDSGRDAPAKARSPGGGATLDDDIPFAPEWR